jgi:hypothetical protein
LTAELHMLQIVASRQPARIISGVATQAYPSAGLMCMRERVQSASKSDLNQPAPAPAHSSHIAIPQRPATRNVTGCCQSACMSSPLQLYIAISYVSFQRYIRFRTYMCIEIWEIDFTFSRMASGSRSKRSAMGRIRSGTKLPSVSKYATLPAPPLSCTGIWTEPTAATVLHAVRHLLPRFIVERQNDGKVRISACHSVSASVL